MFDRRRLTLGMAASLIAGAAGAAAQDATVKRIGILMPYQRGDRVVATRVAGFRDALRRLGWGTSRALAVEEEWVGDDLDLIRAAASRLQGRGIEVILTTGSRVVPIVQAVMPTTSIVFVGTSDPVGQGLVDSLSRPGGNTTGFSLLELTDGKSPLLGELIEFAQQLVAGIKQLGLLFNPDNPATAFHRRSLLETAPRVGIEPILLPVRALSEILESIRHFANEGDRVLVLPSDLTLLSLRHKIVDEVARLRLPTIYSDPTFVRIGGLLSYSADRNEMFKQAAGYVDRILKGERAGDLPIQQPTRYELVVNLATARALGLQLPPSILIRADEVLE